MPLRLSLGARALLVLAAGLLAAPAAIGPRLSDDRALRAHLGRAPAPFAEAEAWSRAPVAAARATLAALSDRLPGRAAATRALGELRFFVLGDPPSDALIRADPLLFNGAATADGRLRHVILRRACERADDDRPWEAELAANTRRLAEGLAAPGRRVAFLLVPGKPVLYADRLPPTVAPELRAACRRAMGPAGRLRAWEAEMRAEGLTALYPLDLMIAARDRPHMYPPENFHAEGMGAHLAAWALLAALDPAHPAPGSVPMRPRPARSDMGPLIGFALPMTLLEPDYGPRAPERDRAREQALGRLIEGRRPGQWIRVWRNPDPEATGTALTLSNSFGFYVPQHLAPAYREVVAVVVNTLDAPRIATVHAQVLPAVAPDDVAVLVNDAYAVRFSLARIAGGL